MTSQPEKPKPTKTQTPAELAALLTENEREILWSTAGDGPDEWIRPMDAGGRNGSHHSATLRKLVKRGLFTMRQLGGKKSSCRYKITPLGNQVGIALRKAALAEERFGNSPGRPITP